MCTKFVSSQLHFCTRPLPLGSACGFPTYVGTASRYSQYLGFTQNTFRVINGCYSTWAAQRWGYESN